MTSSCLTRKLVDHRSCSYAFDVDPKTHAFVNRRVLAYIDAGVPDGIQVDSKGNVYTACADGVQVGLTCNGIKPQ